MKASCVVVILGCTLAACRARDELPGPPINTFQQVSHGTSGHISRSRGVLELYLTRRNPSTTFWNDPETRKDPWGTITLKEVRPDGTAVIDFSGRELRAREGRVFPGTGVKLIAANPDLGTALLRSRWTHTIMGELRPATRPGGPPSS